MHRCRPPWHPCSANSCWRNSFCNAAASDPSHAVSVDQAVALAGELARLLDQVETEGLDFGNLGGLVPETYAAHWQTTLDFLTIGNRALAEDRSGTERHWPGGPAPQAHGGADGALAAGTADIPSRRGGIHRLNSGHG